MRLPILSISLLELYTHDPHFPNTHPRLSGHIDQLRRAIAGESGVPVQHQRGEQPIAVRLVKNTEGTAQVIRFDSIPDVKAGTKSLTLRAESDAGLPAKFFVVAGPTVVRGDQLEFTSIPPRAKFPLAVTVSAWQWGRPQEPKIKAAGIVQRTFRLVR